MEIDFLERLRRINGPEQVYTQEPMSRHTTFRIGGNADYFVCPSQAEQLRETLGACREAGMPFYILGNGSNVLVSDAGYRGVVIHPKLLGMELEGVRLRVRAGELLVRTAHEAARAGLGGLEFASGIPGSVGGALVMNAGAYGGEIKDVLERALVLTPKGEQIWLGREELELGYRTSILAKKSYLVLEAVFLLEPQEQEQIYARMAELKEARVSKQPLEYASAGSTFKRPAGYFAGKLIMDAGLRGFRVGGAQVSEKHCGFVINRGGATARDVLELVEHVREEVKRQFGVELELEVKLLGFDI